VLGLPLGLRDLLAADALESAQPAPAAPRPATGRTVLVVGLGPPASTSLIT
jgi:hypothetical protein